MSECGLKHRSHPWEDNGGGSEAEGWLREALRVPRVLRLESGSTLRVLSTVLDATRLRSPPLSGCSALDEGQFVTVATEIGPRDLKPVIPLRADWAERAR